MASEKLTTDLWEIIQKNNQEEISFKDFDRDLNMMLNLPKDEVDRAISKMISQAEVNPNIIGENKGGSFSISQGFVAAVKSTIKFENQFIPGKEEYVAREMSERILDDISAIAFIGIEKSVIDAMIDNFANLTSEEVIALAGQFYKMNDEEKEKFLKGQKQRVQDSKAEVKSKQAKDALEEIEENLNENTQTYKEMKEGSLSDTKRDAYRKAIMSSKEFKKYYFIVTGKNIDENFELTDEDINIWLSYGSKSIEERREIEVFLDKALEAVESGNLEKVIKLLLENPALGEKYLDLIENAALKRGYDLNAIMGIDEETISGIDNAIRNRQVYHGVSDGTTKSFEIPTSKGTIENITLSDYTGHKKGIIGNQQVVGDENSNIQPNSPFYLKRIFEMLRGLETTSQNQILNQNIHNNMHGSVFKILHSDVSFKDMSSAEGQDYWDATVVLKREYARSREVSEFTDNELKNGEESIERFQEELLEDGIIIEGLDDDESIMVDESEFQEVPLDLESTEGRAERLNNNFGFTNESRIINDKKTKTNIPLISDYIPEGVMDKYADAHAVDLYCEGEPSIKSISKPGVTGIGLFKTNKEYGETRKIIDRIEARRVAGRIVSVLKLIGSVRSGDVRDAQQAVASLTKVGKNLEEATQTADEVEQGE